MSTATTTPALHVRWMIRRDMLEVLDIEQQSADSPLGEAEFRAILGKHDVIGMVATLAETERVVGFAVYRLEKTHLEILNLAVHPDVRRSGVGRRLMARLVRKLGGRRIHIRTTVPETRMSMHRFLAASGFRAIGVVRGWFGERDGYDFVFRAPESTTP